MALPPLNHPRDLTDEQWALIGPFLPTLASRKTAEGAWKENRAGLLRSLLEILAQALHDFLAGAKSSLDIALYDFALGLVGHVKGGLGYVAVVAACILSALSGSAVADAAALSALLVPMMVQAGHNRAKSAGLIAAAGCIGPVIPPSIGFIVFGVAAGLSISKLFFAGIFPGLMMGVGLAVAWWWEVRKENVVPPPRMSGADIMSKFVKAIPALLLPGIIIFGLKFGIFTPTEAAVVAAVYSLVVAMFVYRELKWGQLYAVFVTSAKTTAVVMFLVAAALVSAWLITIADLPSKVIGLLEPFMGNKILLMLAMMVLVVIVGTAMDMTPTILILTPVLVPICKSAGIDPIYFGVLFIINNSIGLITPPVGTVLSVVAGVFERMTTLSRFTV